METPDPLKKEEDVLKFWAGINAFETSLELSKDSDPFVFYDGPPFATGTPHYGHLVASTIKDILGRYKTQTGFHVPRRWGWDTHGLPIEFKIEERLGIKTRQEVLDFGIDKYNAECRAIVMQYRSEWRNTITRLGRWVDMDNDYKTMDVSFMESVWWVFSELYKKGLVYCGYKVVPYSMGCATPLSNFEAKSNYKDVSDYSITVEFKLWSGVFKEEVLQNRDIYALVWTTTPWTLPSNLLLAVDPELVYAFVELEEGGKVYIVAKNRIQDVFGKKTKVKILKLANGLFLEGIHYNPLFDYYTEERGNKAFWFEPVDWVKSDSGTGIVHCAPAFGAEDYQACLDAGVITKTELPMCPIDDNGCYTDPVVEWKGQNVKEAEDSIVDHLKEKGVLFKKAKETHPYPYCWRSDTPLIYKVCECWYINVESIRHQLVESNLKTHWVPQTIRDNRFGNWLEGACDWCVSRNRFWGTPIPIWRSRDKTETRVFGSRWELEMELGLEPGTLTDIHLDKLKQYVVQGKTGPLYLDESVFDCWFESGSMPYAQMGYPRTQERLQFADFIAEGLDQTRGWFYTLTVLGTALFGRSPFKNVIVNGIVLNEKGEKMSKSKGNYPPVENILDEFGSDALRLYLINTPVVRAGDIKFKKEHIRLVVQKYHRMITNAMSFYLQMVELYNKNHEEEGTTFELGALISVERFEAKSFSVLDHWILQCLNELITSVHHEMDTYELHGVVEKFLKFIDQLSRGYMNLNKGRFKSMDANTPLSILGNCLYNFALITAPFAPFLSEIIWNQLKPSIDWESWDIPEERRESIHFHLIPSGAVWKSDGKLLELFEYFSDLTDLTRVVRSKRTREVDGKSTTASSIKLALPKMTVIHQDISVLEQIDEMEWVVKEEMNVEELVLDTNISKYISFSASLDIPRVKERVKDGKTLGKIIKFCKTSLTPELIRSVALGRRKNMIKVEDNGSVKDHVWLLPTELTIRQSPKMDNVFCTDRIAIAVEDHVTPEILDKYYYKLFYRGYQEARKESGFQQTDDVRVTCFVGPKLREIIEKYNTSKAIDDLVFSTNSNEFLSQGLIHKVDCDVSLALIILEDLNEL